MYVCNIGVCLFEKCSILLPKVTNQTFPAVHLLSIRGETMRTVVICFLFKWCQLCEMGRICFRQCDVNVKSYVSSVSCNLFWKARGNQFACFVYRLWAVSTSACVNLEHVNFSGLTEVIGADFKSVSHGQPCYHFKMNQAGLLPFPRPSKPNSLLHSRIQANFFWNGSVLKTVLAPWEEL